MKNSPIIVILMFLLLGCKENSTTPDEPTSEDLIIRTWQVQAMQVNGQDATGVDFSDYRFTFRPDQTYRFLTVDERQGIWEISANATLLLLDPGTQHEEFVSVLQISENNLVLEFTEESVKLGTTQTRFELVP
jgi:hypothetical protein